MAALGLYPKTDEGSKENKKGKKRGERCQRIGFVEGSFDRPRLFGLMFSGTVGLGLVACGADTCGCKAE